MSAERQIRLGREYIEKRYGTGPGVFELFETNCGWPGPGCYCADPPNGCWIKTWRQIGVDVFIEKLIEAREAATDVERARGGSRELSLVKTKLDEAIMWENARREMPKGAGGEQEPFNPADPTVQGHM